MGSVFLDFLRDLLISSHCIFLAFFKEFIHFLLKGLYHLHAWVLTSGFGMIICLEAAFWEVMRGWSVGFTAGVDVGEGRMQLG